MAILYVSPKFSSVGLAASGKEAGTLAMLEVAAPALSASGEAKFYVDSTSHTLKYSANGGAYANVGSAAAIGSAVSGGTANSVLYVDASGNLGQDPTRLQYSAAGMLAVGPSTGGVEIDGSGIRTYSDSSDQYIQTRSYGSGLQPGFIFLHGNGTRASPTALSAADQALGAMLFRGHTTTSADRSGAQISAHTEAAWSVGSAPGYLAFATTPVGGIAIVKHGKVASDGVFHWGSVSGGTAAAQGPFQISAAGDVVTIGGYSQGDELSVSGDGFISTSVFGYGAAGVSGGGLGIYGPGGTRASPSATPNTKYMGLDFGGYTSGGSFPGGARIRGVATETWSAGNTGMELQFFATANASTGPIQIASLANAATTFTLTRPSGDVAQRISSAAGGQSRLEMIDAGATGWSLGHRGSDDNFYLSLGVGDLSTTNKLLVTGAGAVTWTSTLFGIGITPTKPVHVDVGTVNTGTIGQLHVGVINNTTATVYGEQHIYTTAGSASGNSVIGVYTALVAGTTTNTSTNAAQFYNPAATTGTQDPLTITNAGANAANSGAKADADQSGAGTNIGFRGHALNATGYNVGGLGNVSAVGSGSTNFGLLGVVAATASGASKHVGVAGFALNGTAVGGYFQLGTGTPTYTASAFIADNGAVAAPIMLLRDNGTDVVTVADGGDVGFGVAPSEKFSLKDHSAFAGSESNSTTGAVQTTDATQTTAKTITLSDTKVHWVTVRVTARETTGADRAAFTFIALAYREGGGATLQGSVTDLVTPIKSVGATTWAATLTVSGNDLRVSVTGAAATTINWAVDVEYQGVSGSA